MTQDIFLLVFDSLRRDEVEPYSDTVSTPSLSELAGDSFILKEAYSTGSWTVPAHGSLFTGKYPSQHGATGEKKELPEGQKTIAEVAAEYNYEPIAISTNPWISPTFGFYRGFGQYSQFVYPTLPFPNTDTPEDVIIDDCSFSRNLIEILKWAAEENTVKRLLKYIYKNLYFEEKTKDASVVTDCLISSIDNVPSQQSIFAFANYMDAHEPYFEGVKRSQMTWNLYSVESTPKLDPTEIKDAYRSAVSTLDKGIGKLIDRLKQRGRYDDALIIGIADHGQSLGEHDYWGHGTYLYDELLHVPAFIKPPGGCQTTNFVSEVISIKELYGLIERAFKGDISIEKWLNDVSENVVAAQSVGPHIQTNIDLSEVSEQGYWKFYGESWNAQKSLDSGELIISRESNAPLESEIHQLINRKVKQNNLRISQSSSKSDTYSTDIEQRLDHLGYI